MAVDFRGAHYRRGVIFYAVYFMFAMLSLIEILKPSWPSAGFKLIMLRSIVGL